MTDNWRDELPEELQGNETLERFKSPADLAKSYLEARSTLGNSIRIPSKEAGEDAMDAFVNDLVTKAPNVMLKPNLEDAEQSAGFYRTMGVPDEATGYTAPEGVEMPDELAKSLQEAAHGLKLTDRQYQQFAKQIAEETATQQKAIDDAFKEGHSSLKEEWGAAYEKNRKAAERIFKDHAVGGEFDKLNAEGVRSFYNISQAMLSDSPQVDSQPEIASQAITPNEAAQRIQEIMNNKEHPYWNPGHPDNAMAQQEMLKLQAYKLGMEPPEKFAPFGQL